MGDIEEIIDSNITVQKIYESYEKKQEHRKVNSLGASVIGRKCKRYLWYLFRHCIEEKFNGRMLRLFETGNREEERLANNLKAIGCEVHTATKDGKQYHVEALGGHLSGYMDGCALGIPEAPKTWHVLEFKTVNNEGFKKLKKDGVLGYKPEHYWQMMIYMHLSGMKRALYLSVNKNDDEIYQERIRYDKEQAEIVIEKAKSVITLTSPPERISDKPDYFECKFCNAKQLCFGSEPPLPALPIPCITCRQCCHATPVLSGVDAQWQCEKHQRGLSFDDQQKACKDHLILPALLATHQPTDYGKLASGEEYIEFSHKEFGKFKHGNGRGLLSAEELTKLPIPLLSNQMLDKVREKFDAQVSDSPDTILKDYSCSRLAWKGQMSKDAINSAWENLYKDSLLSLQPLRVKNTKTYSIVEYPGCRVVMADLVDKIAEIRDKNFEVENIPY